MVRFWVMVRVRFRFRVRVRIPIRVCFRVGFSMVGSRVRILFTRITVGFVVRCYVGIKVIVFRGRFRDGERVRV